MGLTVEELIIELSVKQDVISAEVSKITNQLEDMGKKADKAAKTAKTAITMIRNVSKLSLSLKDLIEYNIFSRNKIHRL